MNRNCEQTFQNYKQMNRNYEQKFYKSWQNGILVDISRLLVPALSVYDSVEIRQR